jgi:hypothetical protein
MMKYDLKQIFSRFQIDGEFLEAAPYGSGHINDTFSVDCRQGDETVRYVFQRINHNIFKNPPELMSNVARVTRHIRSKLESCGTKEIERKVLTLIPTVEGGDYYKDGDGNYWRAYVFIRGARTYDVLKTLDQAHEAAKAFGNFQNMLSDFPQPPLFETIPDFHNGLKRFETFQKVLKADVCNRAKDAKEEIEYLLANSWILEVFPKLVEQGVLPIRITHNDTKINNVMIDDKTNEGICVIDLDTVMPGLALYDFGDIVRTTASNSEEDEIDLSKVKAEVPRFKAIVKGYLEGAGGFLKQAEIDQLVHAGKFITFVIGTRFLTDYLDGDNYFKVHREGHNLHRCRTQFKLVRSLTEQEEELNQLVRNCYQQITGK